MYIIDLKYVKEIEEIEKNLQEHRVFLDRYYQTGVFLMSGRKEPRTGGIILAKAPDKETIERIITEDPFYKAGVVQYTITEFIPTKTASDLVNYQE